MLEVLKKYREIILYLIFGVLTTIVNIVSFYVLADMVQLHYLIANAGAWLLSVVFAFFTNRKWVFASTSSEPAKEFIKFVSCRLFSGGCDMAIMFLSVDVLHIHEFIAKLLANVVVVVLNGALNYRGVE